ncbi:MAG: hypothetical protein GEV28_31565 [Actinophytocola sp.]|uniref:SAM-dependent methyltransferase n=1 Tax=Actinophytocola sp. TaxID=1872138 RepID=UPI0013217D69|nr:SAM-dependent methyltransferase [Actinophytocola sp.]MPZ84680.1 hypothetical protein [Actinophytocola sp.]
MDRSLDQPALARVYNGATGGASTSEVDRSLLQRVFALMPGYRYFAMANLRFAGQAVTEFVDAGITQILDLGCGMLSPQSSHTVAHARNPDVRVVYVDLDSVTAEHARLGTAGDDRVGVLEADVRQVDDVLDDPVTRRLLSPDEPVGVLAAAVLHCLPDDGAVHPADTLRRYHDRLPAGSMLAATHATGDTLDPDVVTEAIALFQQAGITVLSRTAEEFHALFGPWQVRPPGLRPLRWSPQPDEEIDAHGYTATALKPR